MIKICHVTSVHAPEDIRIFQKECVSLAKAGYDVTLVQRGDSYDKDGVHIVGFGDVASSRIKRMLFTARQAYRKALTVDADVYHFHDPELLPYALKMKKKGKKVIFDSHEDVPADIQEKYWLPAWIRKTIARVYLGYETRVLRRLDATVSVSPPICKRLESECDRVVMITNYPILANDLPQPVPGKKSVVFPGLVSSIWCIHNVIQALEKLDGVTLELRSGNISGDYLQKLSAMPGWKRVNYPGKVSHAEVLKLMANSLCGVALLHECPNSAWEQGTLGNTKIFEYMMIGVPVVCTNFVLWRVIIDKYHCGICVDPENVDEIANAIQYLLDHPEEARQMGENGRRAIREEFNWGVEEKKLLALYEDVLKN